MPQKITGPLGLLAGYHYKFYRKSWADVGYEPSKHHFKVTRIAMVRTVISVDTSHLAKSVMRGVARRSKNMSMASAPGRAGPRRRPYVSRGRPSASGSC